MSTFMETFHLAYPDLLTGASPGRDQNRSSDTRGQDPFQDDNSNGGTTGITREDMKDPQYSYLSSLYGPGSSAGRTRQQPPRSSNPIPDPVSTQQQSQPEFPQTRSIPRKEIGSSGSNLADPVSSSPAAASSGHARQSSLQKPLPAAPMLDPRVDGDQNYNTSGNQNTIVKNELRDSRRDPFASPAMDPRVDGDSRLSNLINAQKSPTAATVLDPRVDGDQRSLTAANQQPIARNETGSTRVVATGNTIRGPRPYGEPNRDTSSIQNSARSSHSNTIIGSPHTTASTQEVLDRAKTNSKDTEVIERIAPGKASGYFCGSVVEVHDTDLETAVVHETVKQDVHHVREEVVTREIHTHDVYHRILPIIDVEVLPPRHFLPVEGGGLVEVSADEVPGRRNNWVIAETASKIPSGDPVSTERRSFTAREFPGEEGDDKSYVTPEGVETTEQTWVHPPILETGARATGQTYPFPMDSGKQKRKSHGYSRYSPTKNTPTKGILKQPASETALDPEFAEGNYPQDTSSAYARG